jgi:hypothetical protein
LYYGDNRGNKSFDQKQWQAIKSWTKISKGKRISKKEAENMFKYIRELKDLSYRRDKFWLSLPDYQEYNFQELKQWCGLDLEDDKHNQPWWEILQRNFKPEQVTYFIRLLKRYGQKQLNADPQIVIDTIHSVKGGEADNVLIYSKGNYPSVEVEHRLFDLLRDGFVLKTKEEHEKEKQLVGKGQQALPNA